MARVLSRNGAKVWLLDLDEEKGRAAADVGRDDAAPPEYLLLEVDYLFPPSVSHHLHEPELHIPYIFLYHILLILLHDTMRND